MGITGGAMAVGDIHAWGVGWYLHSITEEQIMKHFRDCPVYRNWDMCTCDMRGEEIALVEWQIKRQEGQLRWWNVIAKLSLSFFGPPDIKRINGIEGFH